MRSKAAVIISLLFVLAVGGAALAVNMRILNTSPQPDFGRANEVLVPGNGQPAIVPTPLPVAQSVAPTPAVTAPPPGGSPHGNDEHSRSEHQAPEQAGHERDD